MKSRKIRRLEFVSDKIDSGIARGSSCASVLFIPRRKMSMCEAHHGRAAVAGVGASMDGHGKLVGEGEEGEGGGRGGAARGAAGEG
jgi:hypothetical protein